MEITASMIRAFVENELGGMSDERVVRHVRSLLVEPSVIMRDWDYGLVGEAYPFGRRSRN